MTGASTRLVLRSALVYARSFSHSTAVIIEDGRIAWVGDDGGLVGQLLADDVVVDCEERLVTASFIDASAINTAPIGAAQGARIVGAEPGAATLEIIGEPDIALSAGSAGFSCADTSTDAGLDRAIEQAQTTGGVLVVPGGLPGSSLRKLVSAGVPYAFGSRGATSSQPWEWIRSAVLNAQGISARAAFNACTRAGWRAAGIPERGDIAPGIRASLNVWTCAEFDVQAADDRLARWSTDPRSGTAPLPTLGRSTALPDLWATVRGRDLELTP